MRGAALSSGCALVGASLRALCGGWHRANDLQPSAPMRPGTSGRPRLWGGRMGEGGRARFRSERLIWGVRGFISIPFWGVHVEMSHDRWLDFSALSLCTSAIYHCRRPRDAQRLISSLILSVICFSLLERTFGFTALCHCGLGTPFFFLPHSNLPSHAPQMHPSRHFTNRATEEWASTESKGKGREEMAGSKQGVL